MPLIRTKLLLPTNTKGTRIKAYYQGQSVTIGYSYTGVPEIVSNHVRGCIAMLDKLGIDWLELKIQSERLNIREFVHICKDNSKGKTYLTELPEFLRPQA